MQYDIWQEPMMSCTVISDNIQTVVVDAENFNCLYSEKSLYEFKPIDINCGYILTTEIFNLIKSLRKECKGKIWNYLVTYNGTWIKYIIFKREIDNTFSVWVNDGSTQLNINKNLVKQINWKLNNNP